MYRPHRDIAKGSFLLLLLVIASSCAALQCARAGSHGPAHKPKPKPKPGHPPVTLAEVEAEYMQWVAREGQRLRQKEAAASADVHHLDGATFDFRQSNVPARVITVSKNGRAGTYSSVQAAVNSVKSGNQQRVVIQIEAGVYEEKVKIPKKKPYITFEGSAQGQTVITYHDNARTAGTTFKSATVSVMSDGFIARNIIFKNTAPYPETGSRDMQAVAFQISGDKAAFYDCHFLGAQDTLYDHKGRHYFYNCFIQGSVDFIFGGGRSLYQKCELNAISKGYGSYTAQKRKSASEDSGFSFVSCKLTGSGVLYLGRAWGPYSRVVFINSYIDAQIVPEGWYNWGDPSRERTVFYGQYGCSGPGANLKSQAAWARQLTASEAAPFMSLGFVDGEEWVSQ